MHFYVLGGSGRTGSVVIKEALTKGHTVTTLARDVNKILPQSGLTICQGTPFNKHDIEISYLKGGHPDAVLVTLSGSNNDNPFGARGSPPDILKTCNENVISVMQQNAKPGAKAKIVILQAMGVGSSYRNLNFLVRLMANYASNFGAQFRDHEATEIMVREKATTTPMFVWVLVRPPMLKGDEALPITVLGDNGDGATWMPTCSRASVAKFMVEAAEGREYEGRTPVIVN